MNSRNRVWGSVSGCPPKSQPGLEPLLHLVAGPRISTWWLVLELLPSRPGCVCVVCCLLLSYAHACVQICVPVHAGTEATGRLQVSRSITLVRIPLRQGFFLNPKLGWQPEIQLPSSLHLHSTGMHAAYYKSAGNSNSGPRACSAGALTPWAISPGPGITISM